MTSQKHAFSRGTIFAVVALIAVVSVTSVAMSSSSIGNTDNESYVGTRDPGGEIAAARPVRSAHGNTADWGVFAYQSDRGLTCVQAGIVENGKVGAHTREGFRAYAARDSVGNCGDLTDTLSTLGGAVYAAAGPATDDLGDQSAVVYGLLATDVVGVTVTVDDTSANVPAQIVPVEGIEGVSGTFTAPLPAGVAPPDVSVTFQLKNGETSASAI